MIREDRDAILRVGLLLAMIGGWAPIHSLGARLDGVEDAVGWLRRHGYVQSSEYGEVARWLPQRSFEALWRKLIPDRPCPIRLSEVGRVIHRVA